MIRTQEFAFQPPNSLVLNELLNYLPPQGNDKWKPKESGDMCRRTHVPWDEAPVLSACPGFLEPSDNAHLPVILDTHVQVTDSRGSQPTSSLSRPSWYVKRVARSCFVSTSLVSLRTHPMCLNTPSKKKDRVSTPFLSRSPNPAVVWLQW